MIALKPHTAYSKAERVRLRRLARREVPEVPTTAPKGPRAKPFYMTVPARIAEAFDWPAFAAGAAMAGLCREELALEGVGIRWIVQISPAQAGAIVEAGRKDDVGLHRIDMTVQGAAGPDAPHIRLAVTWSPEETARTAAHEVRHLWQHRHWPEAKCSDHTAAEEDANEYADEAMRRMWPAVEQYVKRHEEA